MTPARFLQDADGSTHLSLFWFAMVAMLSGLAIDTSNAWRHEEQLTQAASAAAHAGVVALARGADPDGVRDAAAATAMRNLPGSDRDDVFRSLPQDIQLLRFDPEAGTAAAGPDPDAVRVALHRSAETGSPVRFLLLQLAAAFAAEARTSWNVSGHGMAAVTVRGACAAADGIYSEGELDITSSQTVGAGVCFHGQKGVWMPQRSVFEPGSVVSMPDLDACRTKCADSANPGASAATREINMLPFRVGERIEELRADFLAAGGGPLSRAFFDGRSVVLGASYPDMVSAGLLAAPPAKGEVLTMSALDFEALSPPILGVTYRVECGGDLDSPLHERVTGKKAKQSRNLTLDGALQDIAIMTDCAIHVAQGADLRGAIVVSTNVESGVSADSTTTLGAPGCTDSDRVTLASTADLHVPAGFAGSNLDLLIDGEVHFSGAGGSGGSHQGLSLVASGDVHLSAGHEFRACGTQAPLQQAARLIREVDLVPALGDGTGAYRTLGN